MASADQQEDGAPSVGGFVKYDKMGEDSGPVGAAALSASAKQYVVTEKVHGANFCLIAKFLGNDSTSVDVNFAKRTAILGGVDDAEDFYSCRSAGLLRALGPCAELVLRRMLGTPDSQDVRAVHIYGELFGGRYPHPDVPAAQGMEPVQVGVWYSPNLEFMAFDVVLEAPGRLRRYLDFAVAQLLCEGAGLMFARALCQGTLTECLEFPILFETTLPARLGLPPLPPGAGGGERNVAEGVVVRPSHEPVQRASAAAARGGKESARGLFKRKIEAFSEKRYQNDEWKRGKAGGGGVAPVMNGEELALIEIQASITEQRLAAVLSKIGRVDPNDKAACRQLLSDFKADLLESLEEADAQLLRQSPNLQEQLDQLSKDLIKEDFKRRGLRPNPKAAATAATP